MTEEKLFEIESEERVAAALAYYRSPAHLKYIESQFKNNPDNAKEPYNICESLNVGIAKMKEPGASKKFLDSMN